MAIRVCADAIRNSVAAADNPDVVSAAVLVVAISRAASAAKIEEANFTKLAEAIDAELAGQDVARAVVIALTGLIAGRTDVPKAQARVDA